jgi:hypothetical protein
MSFDYLKNTDIKPPRNELLNMFKLIENKKNMNALEIGAGNLNNALFLSKKFKSYSCIESNKELLNIHTPLPNMILYNMTFEKFMTSNTQTFDVIIFINSIEFLNIKSLKPIEKLLNLNGYIVVQLSRRKPELWGNEKLCKNSIHFDINMWKEKKSDLKRFKKMLMNNKYLVEHIKSYKMRFYFF